jgi:DNA processing protein
MTQGALQFHAAGEALLPPAISPRLEMGAYEALWARHNMSVKKLAQLFRDQPGMLPSGLVDPDEAARMATQVLAMLRERGVARFGLRIHQAGEYPTKLRDARDPVEVLYFQGTWELVETRCVAIVGSRKPSEDGRRRARRLARALVQDDFTVVSGLASGIDTEAHTTAIEAGGRTIAVVGTPLGEYYPPENHALQDRIAREFLLISQVPVFRYAQQTPRFNRLFFPDRNVTMSALTEATVIVEASETSGTLIQARAAIEQRRKLFILESCFHQGLSWPAKYEAQGAIRVRDYDDIRGALGAQAPAD